MPLITRMSRLFRADLHAVLDRLEEPDVLLRQAIREMEESLAGDRQRLRQSGVEGERIESRIADATRALAVIEEQLAESFAAGRDDLARAAVRRRLETGRLAELLSRRLAALQQASASVRQRVEENSARLADLRAKSELLGEPAETESSDACRRPEVLVREDEVELAFLREQRQRRPS